MSAAAPLKCPFNLSILVFSSLSVAWTLMLKRGLTPSKLLRLRLKGAALSTVDYWMQRDEENTFFEEVLGDKALQFVQEQNKAVLTKLGDPRGSVLYNRILAILDSKDKIPHVTKIGDFYYNFWQDELNVKGILRRTTLMSFKSADTKWALVLDLDDLGKAEGENWVYKGYVLHEPDEEGVPPSRILLQLSRGGADATVVREFDLQSSQLVPASEGGFYIAEAKNHVAWKNRDTLLVGTDIGDGRSLTDSGYPRVVREWQRGSPLASAPIVFEGESSDVSCTSYVTKHHGYRVEVHSRSTTFYTSRRYIKVPGATEFAQLLLPDDVQISQFADQILVTLRSAWAVRAETFPGGSLLAVGFADFVANGQSAMFTPLFTPQDRVSLHSYTTTKNFVIVHSLDNVKSRLAFWKYDKLHNSWTFKGAEPQAAIRGSSIIAVDRNANDFYWLTTSSFTRPSALSLANASDGPAGVAAARPLKALPPQFNSTNLVEVQCFATSADGTVVPYFMVHQKGMSLDGSNPTLLYGYGGFEISLPAGYTAITGVGWLEAGGVYVNANIRGGGEFGPKWHQSALRENRFRCYDDFIAIAEDLIARKVTTPKRLACRGGSNGGLLVGNMIVRRPDLFGAVCCAVPLLDMRRFNRLLAGASWQAEYGNPDTDDWAFLQRYSAYHNIDFTSAASAYPSLLVTTSTRDDRVHPYHARAFVKRLLDLKRERREAGDSGPIEDNVYYYENIEGGHGGASDNKQAAFMNSMYLKFLYATIGGACLEAK